MNLIAVMTRYRRQFRKYGMGIAFPLIITVSGSRDLRVGEDGEISAPLPPSMLSLFRVQTPVGAPFENRTAV